MISYAKPWRWFFRTLVLLCAAQVLLGGGLCFTGGKAFKGRAPVSEATTISRSQSEDSDPGDKSLPFTEDWSGFLASPCDTAVVLCGARPGNVGATYRLCCLLGPVCALIAVGLTFGKAQKALELSGVKPGEGVTSLVAPPEQMDAREVLQALRSVNFHLIGLTAHGEGVQALWDVPLIRPGLALVFGREHDGIPPEAEELLHEAATVPMVVPGNEGSLNVSQAAGIVLYERWCALSETKGKRSARVAAVGSCWFVLDQDISGPKVFHIYVQLPPRVPGRFNWSDQLRLHLDVRRDCLGEAMKVQLSRSRHGHQRCPRCLDHTWSSIHNTYPPRRRTTAFRCRSRAMGAVKLHHSDPAEHRAGLMQQLRQFWMDGHLCDVVLKSYDGAEHHAHTAVLSAASIFFKNLLGGSFLEAARVQQKQPVEISASKAAVSSLLDYIYDGQPEVSVEVGLELLRLAEAYNLPKLAGSVEVGIRTCLDSSVALQVLQEAHGLHSMRVACEDKVAEDFETCSQHPDFGKLSVSQLARILKREDLAISREEAVVKAIFAWLKISKDRDALLGVLLQHVQFQSLSIENLLRLGRTTLSGPSGDDLHREVEDALTSRKRTGSPGAFQSKRRRLQHWSPFLGASTASVEASGREVLSSPSRSLVWHQGEIFAAHFEGRILSWKPDDPATCVRPVAGEGAAVTGINDLGDTCRVSISPGGEVFVSDWQNRRLLRFQNGSGDLVVDNVDATALCHSPSGVLYLVSQNLRTVAKVVDSMLETVIAELQPSHSVHQSS
eukprot:s164_g19.t1